MENKYQYLKFGLMPYVHPDIVSPYTPLPFNKKIYNTTFNSGSINIAPLATLEGVILEPFTAVTNQQSPIALYYSTSTVNSSTYDAMFGSAKTLTGSPDLTKGYRYIGGCLKITPTSNTRPTFFGRAYEPPTYNNPTYWSLLNSTSVPSTTFSNPAGPIYINCIPQDLEYRNLSGQTNGYFVRSCYHFRLVNTSPTDTQTVIIEGSWFTEAYEAAVNTITYVQDSYCPYKMAEYVFGHMRSSYMFVEEASKTSLYNGLTVAIDGALNTITNPWALLTSDITITGTAPDPDPEPEPEPTSDEEWAARPVIWNP